MVMRTNSRQVSQPQPLYFWWMEQGPFREVKDLKEKIWCDFLIAWNRPCSFGPKRPERDSRTPKISRTRSRVVQLPTVVQIQKLFLQNDEQHRFHQSHENPSPRRIPNAAKLNCFEPFQCHIIGKEVKGPLLTVWFGKRKVPDVWYWRQYVGDGDVVEGEGYFDTGVP